ncbi:Ribonuclease [Phycisphaerales bacterium]|nr:Ribonuclease [Phycisphaerales bacterium]
MNHKPATMMVAGVFCCASLVLWWMRITFFGAAGEVTGSCYFVETSRARVLVDLGMFQGGREDWVRNRQLPAIDFGALDAVILTHAHQDHAGRLPLLVGTPFHGPVLATPATRDLCDIMLRDSARLHEADAARAVRKGETDVPRPLYTEREVDQLMHRIEALPYETRREIAPGVSVRFTDSGHILGSASVELTAVEPGADGRTQPRTILFSGDVGPRGVPLMNDPVPPVLSDGRAADLVVLESTYGDRDHRALEDTLAEASEIVRATIWDKEKILVPSFAVGRAQLVVYYLSHLAASGRVPRFPIYLDSPMAIRATELYTRYIATLDDHARAKIDGRFPLDAPDLRCLQTAEESKGLNEVQGAAVIIAGSGMCEGGRIVHHLRHGLWRKDVHVVIVGYQANGTLGRRLVDGFPEVRIFGETIPVRAKIHTLGGLSAHAGRSELLDWARAVHAGDGLAGQRIALTHGEIGPREALRGLIRQSISVDSICPMPGQSLEI